MNAVAFAVFSTTKSLASASAFSAVTPAVLTASVAPWNASTFGGVCAPAIRIRSTASSLLESITTRATDV